MADLRVVPPGRAGRLWLRSRLATARLATDLLDRKLRILSVERERFALRARTARQEWQRCWRAADEWGLRAAVTGGPRELRLGTPARATEVSLTWATVTGVHYPAEATCRMPAPADGDRSPGAAALVEAAGAYRAALAAGVASAAADAALRTMERELAVTRKRHRSIADRLVPRLEAASRRLTDEIEETERAENARLRWATADARSRGRR